MNDLRSVLLNWVWSNIIIQPNYNTKDIKLDQKFPSPIPYSLFPSPNFCSPIEMFLLHHRHTVCIYTFTFCRNVLHLIKICYKTITRPCTIVIICKLSGSGNPAINSHVRFSSAEKWVQHRENSCLTGPLLACWGSHFWQLSAIKTFMDAKRCSKPLPYNLTKQEDQWKLTIK